MTVKEADETLKDLARTGTRDEIFDFMLELNIFLVGKCIADEKEKERLKETLKTFLTKAN